jgi:hypothetical protein
MKLMVFVLLFFTSAILNAQERFQFKKIDYSLPEIKQCNHDDLLGDTVAMKLEQFKEVYTKTVICGPPGYVSSTEIQKPDLYYSVQKLTNYYRKCIKKETLPKDIIEKNMVDIINKCLLIFNQDTTPLEQELRAANNSKAIIGVFKKIVIE